MRKYLLLGLALLAAYMAGRSLKRNGEVITLLWALIGATANVTAVGTPKSRLTEERLAAVVTQVGATTSTANDAMPRTGGTFSGSVTVNGTHTVNGQVNAQAVASSGAASSYGYTSHGDVNADNNVNAGGNLTGGGVVTSGDVNATGHVQAGGVVSGSGVSSSGNMSASGQLSGGSLVVNGIRLNLDQSAGGWPIAQGQAWSNSVINVLNALVTALDNSNVIST